MAALQSIEYALVIPALCVAEATYQIGKKQGPRIESLFLRGLSSFDIQAPLGTEWDRLAELVEVYEDFPLGGTDASVIALAERFETGLIVTLDRRHFESVRPRHVERFTLLP